MDASGGATALQGGKMPRQRKKGALVACLGCGGSCFLHGNRKRAVCATCNLDPQKRNRAYWMYEKMAMQSSIDRKAARETRRLPRKDSFNPLVGEKIIESMMRGDW
jgi:ribosomal protein L37E